MPEALLAIPSLQIAQDHSSENENTFAASTATTSNRSSSEQSGRQPSIAHGSKNSRPNNGVQYKTKSRKSNGKRMSRKVTLGVKDGSPQKKSVAKSQIPRPLLLTPSSSSASLATTHRSLRSSPQATFNNSIRTEEQTITTVVQRQKTGLILAYRQRKSISQMDLKNFRRNDSHSGKSLMDHNYYEQSNYASFVHRMDNCNVSVCQSRMAGMKIFGAIMLNAWRKRRNDVKRLMEEVVELKRAATKAKNQLHVINTLFRVEQKRNDELNCQLKQSLDDIIVAKSSCENLTTSVISLRADNALLEQQIIVKNQELDTVNALFSQAKSELFTHMAHQRELQAKLSMEQRKLQTLENQKNDLINEIFEVSKEAKEAEVQLHKELQAKDEELQSTQKELRSLEEQILYLNEYREQQLCESRIKDESSRVEIEMLENEVKHLQMCLNETWPYRLRNYWHHSLTYSKATLNLLHWFAFYLLPATPPPKPHTFPFGLTLDKALNIVKR